VEQNMNAKELEAQKRAQERVTKPLHQEDITSFLRDSSEDQKVTVQDEKEKQRIVRTIAPTPG
jgi:hypothetical protein